MNEKIDLPIWVIGIAFFVFLGLLGGMFLFLQGIPSSLVNTKPGEADLTVIPAPTFTYTPIISAPEYTSTPSPTNVLEIGAQVKINGTGGEGLRLRGQPSLNAEINFLGLEDERFIIIDGPRLQDGFTWWHLESPNDQARNGWAVSDYFQVVNKQ